MNRGHPLSQRTDLVSFHDRETGTITHLVWDRATRQAALIDRVLDFDAKAGRTHTHAADRVAQAVRERHLTPQWILETHAHADHLSAARHLQSQLVDATLDVPQLILPSIQVNVRAGALPPPEDDGASYLKIPLNVIGRRSAG